jgi:hypothetical protein
MTTKTTALIQVLERLGSESDRDRATAAAGLAAFIQKIGLSPDDVAQALGSWAALTACEAPPLREDTDWAPIIPDTDARPGYGRWYCGRDAAVRLLNIGGARQRWFGSVDGDILRYHPGKPCIFNTAGAAQKAVENEIEEAVQAVAEAEHQAEVEVLQAARTEITDIEAALRRLFSK